MTIEKLIKLTFVAAALTPFLMGCSLLEEPEPHQVAGHIPLTSIEEVQNSTPLIPVPENQSQLELSALTEIWGAINTISGNNLVLEEISSIPAFVGQDGEIQIGVSVNSEPQMINAVITEGTEFTIRNIDGMGGYSERSGNLSDIYINDMVEVFGEFAGEIFLISYFRLLTFN
jgi:hypothetical protein